MIKLENVTFSYGQQPVLQDFSLQLSEGCICLAGPSGCGKTTVLRLLLGLETADTGKVTRPERLSVVFQEDRLLPWMSVRRNVRLALEKERYPLADELLTAVGLAEVADRRPASLSGGMCRRVALVRAIAYGGDALLLDEPFNGLDAENKQLLADLIRREYIGRGKPVLLISHVPEDARLLGAKTVYMNGIER